MNATEAQKNLTELFSGIFGEVKTIREWRSNARAEDWLAYRGIYAPRPDIAVGPFNIQEGRYTDKIDAMFRKKRDFFIQLGSLNDFNVNLNPRCLIAIEVENSNKGKHMIGNIINASLLGKVGLIITLRDDYHKDAQRIYKYLKGASERKKILSTFFCKFDKRHATQGFSGPPFTPPVVLFPL